MRELPAGTVTFVFTDIEGSTRLFRRLGQEYRRVLDDHRRLIREAIAEHRGVEVQTEGDAFFVAFAHAHDAVAACLASQLALAAHTWPEGGEIRVRMGMHTGEATPVGGDYVALAVHQAARVAAAGHGGQVLISEATRHTLDASPLDASFVELGDYRLKDFDEPQPLYQLAHPQLRRDFPALKVLPAAGHNLPVQRTSFIGREAELDLLTPLLRQSALLTITGPGGAGKTRLAVELATRVLPDYPNGVWLVELAALVDEDLVATNLASALGIREEPGRPLVDTLLDNVRSRRLLVVLDNCEHVVAACAELVDALLVATPGLTVLATSREPLAIDGERTWVVPPLAMPDPEAAFLPENITQFDAVRLFVHRAMAARQDFALTSTNASSVAEICRRLDGIPLAIELAAARTSVLEPAEIAQRLDDRFGLLTTGSRSSLPRHQTLRATVAWSHDLLTGEERVLLRRLSVFAGSFTLVAAEEVCSDGEGSEGILNALGQLVAKSLVQTERFEGTSRYRLLETIRDYGAEKLAEANEAVTVAARHAKHFTSVVEEVAPHLVDSSFQRSLDRLESEHDEYRTALGWLLKSRNADGATRLAGVLWPFWDYACYAREGRSWLKRVLAQSGAAAGYRIQALVGSACLAWLEDDGEAVEQCCLEGLELAEEVGDTGSRARLLSMYAELLRHREGNLEAAEGLCMEAVKLSMEVGDKRGEGEARRILTLLAWDRGDLENAGSMAEQCLEVFSAAGDIAMSAGASSMLAGLARDRGDLDLAQQRYELSLADFTAARDPQGTAHVTWAMATLAFDQGDHGRALCLGEESLRRYERLGNPRGILQSLKAVADACYLGGDLERADRLANEAMAGFRERGFAGDLVSALHSSARIALARRDLERASALAEEALVPYRSQRHTRDAGPVLCLLGRVRTQQGKPVEALQVAEEARAVFDRAGDSRGVAQALEIWAEAALAAGRATDAAQALAEAAALLAERDNDAAEWDSDVIDVREEVLRRAITDR